MSEDLGGKTLGKYELLERIGRGGMAEVYKGYHAALDRHVAIKILHPFLGEDPQFKDRFSNEARNVAQLRHPNIVQVYDFDFDPQRELYYMVMEHIDGPTLRARLMQLSFQGEVFDIPEAVRITLDLARALAYAHSHGMIHRDLKPGNIMFDSDGRVVLTDFGIARIISGPNMTASGSMIGTPAYMAPEQGLGQSGDHRSDIYSLGIVLYQLVTGVTPFNADTAIAVVLKHVNDPLPPPTSINPAIPDSLERIIYKALAKSPDERYQFVEEMAAHLDDLDSASQLVIPASSREGAVYAAPSPVTPISQALLPSPGEQRLRKGCAGWLLLLAALLSMAGGIYLSFSGLLNDYLPFLPEPPPVQAAPSLAPALPTPTLMQLPTSSPTPDLQATDIRLTVEALATLVVSPAPGQLPDLTATVRACDYDYEILSQTPENGSPYPELTSLTKRITIVNDSLCPLDDDVRLVFVEGDRLQGPEFFEFNRALEPGDSYEIVLNLRTPAHDPARPSTLSIWRLVLPDGTQVGPTLTFELLVYDTN